MTGATVNSYNEFPVNLMNRYEACLCSYAEHMVCIDLCRAHDRRVHKLSPADGCLFITLNAGGPWRWIVITR